MSKNTEEINSKQNKGVNKYVKSPLNYTGGKYKILPQIMSKFPSNIGTFVDFFGGGFNVGANVIAEKIIYNDVLTQVVELLQYLKNTPTESSLEYIDSLIKEYSLTQQNREGYLSLREVYNNEKEKHPLMLYVLICYSFNHQIRFNKNGDYNMPFGLERSSFNSKLRERFSLFNDRLHSINCVFMNEQFDKLKLLEDLTDKDFVYADPPYLNSVATYNEGRTGKDGWGEEDEEILLSKLDELDKKGVKFALSNNLKYENRLLDKWKEKYTVYQLGSQHTGCNYHKKDRSEDKEVLIVNY